MEQLPCPDWHHRRTLFHSQLHLQLSADAGGGHERAPCHPARTASTKLHSWLQSQPLWLRNEVGVSATVLLQINELFSPKAKKPAKNFEGAACLWTTGQSQAQNTWYLEATKSQSSPSGLPPVEQAPNSKAISSPFITLHILAFVTRALRPQHSYTNCVIPKSWIMAAMKFI